jgi:hypothetical protein
MKTTTGSSAMVNLPHDSGKNSGQVSGISLQLLVNQLLSNSMATAFRSKSLIINEISRDVQLSKDKLMVASVIRDLLSTVVTNARNGSIYISADRFRDIITLQVQERNNYNGYALAYSIRAMEAEAAMVGGSISIKGEHQQVITISFSFPNHAGNYQYDC